MRTLFLLSLFCTILILTSAKARIGSFDSKHVRFIDKLGNNFLFRGSEPLDKNNHFVWNKLRKTFKRICEKMGVIFPEVYQLIDISLDTHERSHIKHERRFFENHPKLGKFINWPTHGLNRSTIFNNCVNLGFKGEWCQNPSMQPRNFSTDIVKSLAKNYGKGLGSVDDLIGRTDKLRYLLLKSQLIPQVIYIHCECGCDRTGEMSATYYMRWLGWNLTRSLNYDVTVPDRNIGYKNQVAAQWYCEHLYYSGLYSQNHNDCDNCLPFRCNQ